MNPIATLCQNLHSRVLFKFILPRLQQTELEGVKLDVSKLSPLMKNHIRTGRYEVQERRLAQQSLTKNDVILELGGAIGFIGLYCRKVIGVKHHFSVEANPHTLEQLRRNYELNGLAPHVIHAAAAAEDGEITLNIGGEFWENSVVTKDDGKNITVPALSLSSLIQKMPEAPTALVCDIEGAEQYLDFAQLPGSVTKIIIELHPEMIGQERVDQILAQLSAMGFAERGQEAGTWLLVRVR
jgi:FkbM family methyltransferase